MEKDKLQMSRIELEAACLKQNIVIEREDPFNNTKILLPNIEKINKMIREFDFLVDGACRGRVVNEISKIERFLYDHEDDADARSKFLAPHYSAASMYIEKNRNLLEDKNSENWKYLFVNYFKMEDIYAYFNKKESASSFFKEYAIYSDMVEVIYNVKLMDYLRSQVELENPPDDDRDNPNPIEDPTLRLVLMHEMGILDLMKSKMPENTMANMARFMTAMADTDPSSWRMLLKALENMNMGNEKDILTEHTLNKAHEIMSFFGIENEKK